MAITLHQKLAERRLAINFWLIELLNLLGQARLLLPLKHFIEKKIIQSRCRFMFDDEWYLEENKSVLSDRVPFLLMHFIKFGVRDQRDPNPLFSTYHYTSQTSDYPANVNPLVHYQMVGRRIGLSPTPQFDQDYYLTTNPDVRAAGIDPYEHYLKYGVHEGRIGGEACEVAVSFTKVRSLSAAELNLSDQFVSEDHWIKQFGDKRPVDPQKPTVDVIIPAYRGTYMTLACIQSVLRSSNKTQLNLIVIDDCSPEVELSQSLMRLSRAGLIELVHHNENLGFVAGANNGLKRHPHRDVVLLNSDTLVYNDWLDRLRSHALRDSSVATVTPLTNNGEICSYPRPNRSNPVPYDISCEDLDLLASEVNRGRCVQVPTAVGFCMFIKRAAVDRVGEFDEKNFGVGYGEENDFCLRAQKLGFKDVVAADVFVFHEGGMSFRAQKAARVADATARINRLYPGYDRRIQDFIKKDPLRPARRCLDLARADRQVKDRNILLISHERGGGTEQQVLNRIHDLEAQGVSVFRLSPAQLKNGGVRLRHSQITNFPNLPEVCLDGEDAKSDVRDLLERLNISEIEVHHMADFSDKFPVLLSELAQKPGVELSVFVHDYMALCPRFHFQDNNGKYCGEPNVSGCRGCIKKNGSQYGRPDIIAWRKKFANLYLMASKVVVPHEDVAERLLRYIPLHNLVIDHHEPEVKRGASKPRLKKSEGLRYRVGLLGALSPIKGFNYVLNYAKHAKRAGLPLDFVLVGHSSDDAACKKAGINVTGRYDHYELNDLIDNNNLDVVFIASTVPETWSFTLTAALRSKLPIAAFAIGAQGARLAEYPDRNIVTMPLSYAEQPHLIFDVILKLASGSGQLNQGSTAFLEAVNV